MIQIAEYSPCHFEQLAFAWHALENGKDMTAFQSFEWFRNINRLCLSEPTWRIDRMPVYYLVKVDGKPVLIAPLFIQRFGISFRHILWARRGAHVIGAKGYSDYLNLIYDRFDAEAFEALCSYLRTKHSISSLSFENLLVETDLAKHLLSTRPCEFAEMTCVALSLPATDEAYNSLLSKSIRQNLRTARNRCKRDGVDLTYETLPTINGKVIAEMRALRDQRLAARHAKAKSRQPLFKWLKECVLSVILWLRRGLYVQQDPLLENARPWCLLARHKGELVAFFWGISSPEHRELYVIMAAVHPRYEWYSPGKLCLRNFISEIYTRNLGVRLIDFTRGAEAYKFEMGGRARPTYRWIETYLEPA